MEFNMTAIERNLRYYGPPAALAVGCFIVGLLAAPGEATTGIASILLPIQKAVHFASLAATVAGLFWFSYRVWIGWRVEQGEYEGGCINCGGPMRHLDGRYGAYSKCKMCGAKREGWH